MIAELRGFLNKTNALKLAAGVIIAAVALPAYPCINAYGTDLQGKIVDPESLVGDDLVAALTGQWGVSQWQRAKGKRGGDLTRMTLEQRNDYAVALLHLGQTGEALRILHDIERTKPGLYVTATNLGTAYELAGDNVRARHWILEGIRRNRHSHGGSEWLHVAILNAKLALAADPHYLQKRSVLNMDFGDAAVPKRPTRVPLNNTRTKALTLRETSDAIFRQMRERLQFVKAPDAIVGDVLFDYANLEMLTGTMESASALYDLAIKYGTPDAVLAKQRKAHAQNVIRNARK